MKFSYFKLHVFLYNGNLCLTVCHVECMTLQRIAKKCSHFNNTSSPTVLLIFNVHSCLYTQWSYIFHSTSVWRQYVSLFTWTAAIVSLLLISDRESSRCTIVESRGKKFYSLTKTAGTFLFVFFVDFVNITPNCVMISWSNFICNIFFGDNNIIIHLNSHYCCGPKTFKNFQASLCLV